VNLNTERLAKALLADRNRPVTERTDIGKCFVCERGMMYRGSRFCSERCREWFDAGNQPPIEPVLKTRINCANCGQEFDSKGLRCCSTKCERRYRDRQDNLAIMAEVGIEAAPKRRCANPECAEIIPKWRNGRRVRSDQRFCSPKCRSRCQTPETDETSR
jgi:hypothetical protein